MHQQLLATRRSLKELWKPLRTLHQRVCVLGRAWLKPFGAGKPAEGAVKGSQRQASSLSGNFEQQTVGKAECWATAEMLQGIRNDFRLLKREARVIDTGSIAD